MSPRSSSSCARSTRFFVGDVEDPFVVETVDADTANGVNGIGAVCVEVALVTGNGIAVVLGVIAAGATVEAVVVLGAKTKVLASKNGGGGGGGGGGINVTAAVRIPDPVVPVVLSVADALIFKQNLYIKKKGSKEDADFSRPKPYCRTAVAFLAT
ncbi:hypothetical protein HK100_010896 [Physocladia obscura]|uniref:Uncharacterized protein n=1 Tax=Physocladia obscura TaxID=109957 RepID=A0AAD5T9L2_9FUNG|nr:hypothetical protein HK100_010896 [Physocladia obscura]